MIDAFSILLSFITSCPLFGSLNSNKNVFNILRIIFKILYKLLYITIMVNYFTVGRYNHVTLFALIPANINIHM